MAQFIKMPQKGLTEESAVLTQWHVKEGDRVAAGQPLFSIETGKAVFEVESESSGTVLECIGEIDEEIPVKTTVCVVGEEGEHYSLNRPASTVEEETAPAPPVLPESLLPLEKPALPGSADLKISPRARALAKKRHVDVESVQGTGPSGRIIERDIRKQLDAGGTSLSPVELPSTPVEAAQSDYVRVPNSSIRKAIARNMKASLAELAQLTIQTDFDAMEMLEYRKSLKQQDDKRLAEISLNDMVAYGVSRCILAYPNFNAHYSDTEIRQFRQVHLGIAVDTPNGLMVPTIFHADTASLLDISLQVKQLASACREGSISPEKLQGASFTITNLGAYGIKIMTPVINPPQTAILGVGAIEYKVRMDELENPQFYPAMTLSLTIDHRAVDGAPAARFLQSLAGKLESFPALLAY